MARWLEFQHDTYRACLPRWVFARAHYTGDVLDCGDDPTVSSTVGNYRTADGAHHLVSAGAAGGTSSSSPYLIRKATAETEDAYRERLRLADYTPHFATVVDSLAGMLFANEDDANRPFTEADETNPFGSIEDPETPIGKLWANADGQGTGWLTLYKQLTTELIVTHTAWVLVDSVDGEPQVRLLPPESVPNWVDGVAGPVDVLVREDVDTRDSVEVDPSTSAKVQYLRYTLTGWQRYEAGPGGQVVALDGPDDRGSYSFEDASGNLALPIYPITLPMARPVGWMLAKKANAIFNKESERDHLLRYANFPKLNANTLDDPTYDKFCEAIAKGASILPGQGHEFIAPDVGPATIATEVLKRKVEEFYIVAFREYGDAAKERTATEVRQDVSSGVGAFLQLLKAALEDAENQALWRIAQVLWPAQRDRWFTARVERSDEFLPGDINATVERTRGWFFGKDAPIPLGRGAQIAAARQVADFQGLEVIDGDIEAAVDLGNLKAAIDLMQSLPVPAQARAMLAIRLFEVTGLLPAETQAEMGDGETRALRDVLLEQAFALASAGDEQARQAAETFRATGTDPGAPDGGTPTPGTPGGQDVSVTIQQPAPTSFSVQRDGSGRITRLVKE